MRKSKSKVAKKALLQNIKKSLVKNLKKSTSEMAKSSKKLNKLINKESKKLVKHLAKKLKINKSALKTNDRPSVSLGASGAPTTPKSVVSAREKKSPSAKMISTVPTSAGSSKSPAGQTVKKSTAIRKAKVTP